MSQQNIQDIRDLIKTAIKIGRRVPITVDKRTTMHWWELINQSLYDNKLTPPVDFEFKWFYNDVLGWCRPYGKSRKDGKRRVKLGMSTDLDTLDEFLIILIHETVHQCEYELEGVWHDAVAHSKYFYSWRNKIEEYYDAPLKAKYAFT